MARSIHEELEKIRCSGLYRSTRSISSKQAAHVAMNGQDMLLLCSNNYLGLADHPDLIEASVRASEQYGTSSAASRLVSGTMELHQQLETAVAAFKGTEAALVFNGGYPANIGIIGALAGRGDVIFSDRLNHASIVDGALLSGARLVRYPHNDISSLSRLVQKHHGCGRNLIVTDGVFSMDGDMARLCELVALKNEYGALLMVDDAHGSGVLGENGRGTAEYQQVSKDIDINMGTFGKAFGSFGAYAAVSVELRELLINRARSFIFSTSLPPSVLAASLAAIRIVQSDEGKRLREELSGNARFFRAAMQQAGFTLPAGATQIIPVITGDAAVTMQFSESLLERGIFTQGIRPPTVPAGSCRLRCTVLATHTRHDLEWATEQFCAVGESLGIL